MLFNKQEQKVANLFSYVPQEIYLLDDTLRNNIAFGEKDEDINDSEIKEIVKMSGLTSLVEKNKKGLDLIVGERGVRLSGGEKQRVGIARALYKKPTILILDEATSSLDTITEKDIIKSINSLKSKITIIIVTHRLNTVKDCEKILFLKNGKLIDSGNLEYLKNKYPEDF